MSLGVSLRADDLSCLAGARCPQELNRVRVRIDLTDPTQYLGLRDEVPRDSAARQTETGCRPGRRCPPCTAPAALSLNGPSENHASDSSRGRRHRLATPTALPPAACDPTFPPHVPTERPTSMQECAPVTVTHRVDARLLLSETCDVSFPTLLHYSAMDPYAVTATFLVGHRF